MFDGYAMKTVKSQVFFISNKYVKKKEKEKENTKKKYVSVFSHDIISQGVKVVQL